MRQFRLILLLCLAAFCPALTNAQQPSEGDLTATQRSKMIPLEIMDGVWRGTAWTILPDGKKLEMIQTERIGSMLDGAVKVVEGRGYDGDGKVVFNAFATITYDTAAKQLTMHSCAQGRVGNFKVELMDMGYAWEIPAGPAKIRYVAKIENGKWLEYGERVVPNQEPFRFFEMNLSRQGDTDWPAGGAVPMKDEDGRTKR